MKAAYTSKPELLRNFSFPLGSRPKWPGIAALAQRRYVEAMVWPADLFGPLAEGIRRLATDPRMERVWRALFKRQGGMASGGEYMLRPNKEKVRAHPHWTAAMDGFIDGQHPTRMRANLLLVGAKHILTAARHSSLPFE